MSDAIPNAEQISNWNDASGPRWAELSELLDRQIEDVSQRALAALAPRAGERLLDVGCGCGRSSVQLAERVGAGGAVVGVDVSRPMLSVARRRAEAAGLTQLRFVEADAQTHALDAGAFDGIFSCFGVMFFADARAAFSNLRRALKPGGRLAFLCWRAAVENPVMTGALAAARHRFPPQPPPPEGGPGPFAFADAAHVRSILEAAGFAAVTHTPHDTEMGGNTLEDSLTLATRIGPLGGLLRAHPDRLPDALGDVRVALAPCVRDGLVWQRAATWVVTARGA